MEHFGKGDLVAFFYSSPNRSLHAKVIDHLLGGCVECHARAKEVLGIAGDPKIGSYRQELAVILRESALLRGEKEKAAATWARLADLAEKQRLEGIRSRRGIRNYGLAAYVLDEAEFYTSRGRSVKAAELVRFSAAVSDCLPARIYGAAPLADINLRRETVLCQIKRLDLDFIGALTALQRAERFKDCGIAPEERARFFRAKARVLFDLGDLEEAAKAASERRRIHEEIFDFEGKAKALLQEARITRLLDPRTALNFAEEGLKLLTGPEPKPLLSGIFSKCDCLIKLGRLSEADQLLASSREQIRQLADAEDELWFRHIDALLLKAKGNAKDADAVLCHIALRFREEGLYQAMLFQHLERIRIRAEAGRWKSAVNIATRLTPELAALGLRNDLLGMWASLQDSLSQRRDVVSEIENLFRRRWNVPGHIASR